MKTTTTCTCAAHTELAVLREVTAEVLAALDSEVTAPAVIGDTSRELLQLAADKLRRARRRALQAA